MRDFIKNPLNITKEIIRVDGLLKEIVTVKDVNGNLIHKITSPLMVEFNLRDMFQIIVGSMILALPVSVTQEVWELTESMPLVNVLVMSLFSVTFITFYIYYSFYKGSIRGHALNFIKRVILTYVLTLATATFLLTIIVKLPWQADMILTMKRILFIGLPASFAATIADSLK